MQFDVLQAIMLSCVLIIFDILLWFFPDQYFAMRAISLKFNHNEFNIKFKHFKNCKNGILPISLLIMIAIILQVLSLIVSYISGSVISIFVSLAVMSMIITTVIIVNAFNRAWKQLDG